MACTISGASVLGRMWRTQQLRLARAARNGALDVGLRPDRQHHGAHHAHDARHLGDDDGDDHDPEARPRQRDERDGEQDRRDRHDAVHGAHDDAVHAPEIAAEQPDGQADQARDRRHRQADDQRDAGAVDSAREHVPAVLVGAEPERLRRRPQPVDRRLRNGSPAIQRRGQRHRDERPQQDAADEDRGVAAYRAGPPGERRGDPRRRVGGGGDGHGVNT